MGADQGGYKTVAKACQGSSVQGLTSSIRASERALAGLRHGLVPALVGTHVGPVHIASYIFRGGNRRASRSYHGA